MSESKKVAAIVLSAGTGKRMGSSIPKQYLPILEKPVIYYSLYAFERSLVDEIVLVCGADDIDYCRQEIVEKYNITKVTAIVAGGKERYNSVYEGLKAIGDADVVLIHDGARPLIDDRIIKDSIDTAREKKACVVGMPVKDTIKVVENGQAIDTPDRSSLYLVQTPQSFGFSYVFEAYKRINDLWEKGEKTPAITDDAMVVEYVYGENVAVIEGSYENIKITTPYDLVIAETILRSR